MNALFISYNLFCIDKKDGGRLISARNRDCLARCIDGDFYTIFIVFSEYNNIEVQKNEIILQGSKNKIYSLINYLRNYAMITPKIEKFIIDFIIKKEISIVFFDTSIFGRTIKKVVKKTNSKTICYMHNVEALYSLNRVKNESRLFYPMYKSYCYNEKLAITYSNYLININERDAKMTQKMYGRCPDAIINVSLNDILSEKDIPEVKEEREELKLLFIGSYFQPNIQGITWFVNNVVPYVPATLTIVGKGMEVLKGQLTNNKVNVVGSIEDLSKVYLEYDAIVLPIFSGSGMKVKTAEAMMYGKILFATDEALEGYQEIPNKIFRCNNREEFISSIIEYKKQGITRFSRVVRQRFLDYYSDESAFKKFVFTMERI